MSGGSMDYAYSRLEWVIPTEESIDKDEHIEEKGKPLAKECIKLLREAVIIAKRLEWFLSGDDGADSFESRLKNELGRDILKNN